MKDALVKITNDLYDVAARLKSVNENYVVYYNAAKRRYEVYERDVLAFVSPYSQLDCRIVDYARKTARQNADKIFEEIEQNNNALAVSAAKNALNNFLNSIKEKK